MDKQKKIPDAWIKRQGHTGGDVEKLQVYNRTDCYLYDKIDNWCFVHGYHESLKNLTPSNLNRSRGNYNHLQRFFNKN